MKTLEVKAVRWEKGWMLNNAETGECMTQVENLNDAREQVVDYLDTSDPTVYHSNWKINVVAE